LVLDADLISDLDLVRRNVDFLSVDADVAVERELTRLRLGAGEAGAVDNVVETALEHDDQVLARRSLDADSLFKVRAELTLKQAVGALHLLLLAQLQAVAGDLGTTRLAVLTRNEVALFDGALLGETPQTF